MRRGSWPPLLAAALLFLGAFTWQRHRSTFLRIEAESRGGLKVAAECGLEAVDVMALRELTRTANDALRDVCMAFARDRQQLGDALAAVAASGERAAAEAARAAAPDPATAWASFALRPEAIGGLRFLAMRRRFDERD